MLYCAREIFGIADRCRAGLAATHVGGGTAEDEIFPVEELGERRGRRGAGLGVTEEPIGIEAGARSFEEARRPLVVTRTDHDDLGHAVQRDVERFERAREAKWILAHRQREL